MTSKSGMRTTSRSNGATYAVTVTAILMTYANMAAVSATGALSVAYRMTEETMTSLGDIMIDSGLSGRYNVSVADQIRFSILKGVYAEYFRFSPPDWHVLRTSNVPLDRDVICPEVNRCVVQLDVAVAEPISLFEIIKVDVTIDDLNDNAPTFPEAEITVYISESVHPGVPTVLPLAHDGDSGQAGNVSYFFHPDSSVFYLDYARTLIGSPELRLVPRQILDRESRAEYELEIQARDNGTPQRSGSLQLTVVVTDVNDNPPRFDYVTYNVTISEDSPISRTILTVHATDPDIGDNGLVVYSFSRQTALQYGSVFGLDPHAGDVYLVSRLDYETRTSYYLSILATDKGSDPKTATARVSIRVLDVNDVTPRVTINVLTSSGEAEVPENGPVGEFVAHLSVEDPDGGPSGAVSCDVIGTDRFEIVEIYDNEFKLLTNDTFDHEFDDVITVSVRCTDGGTPPLSTTVDLEVTILDVNDNSPVFVRQTYTTSIRENASYPQPIFFVSAVDKDGGRNGRVNYQVDESGARYLAVNATSGLVSSNSRLDREQVDRFTTLVYAVDAGSPPLTGTATISVVVDDVNDEAPYFRRKTYVFGTFENQAIGTTIGQVAALDRDVGPRAAVVYTLAPDSRGRSVFRIDPETGRISTKRVLDREQTELYVFRIVATNTMYPYYAASATVSVHVADKNDLAPTITFPTKVNNSVEISASARRGSTVTRVVAWDGDVGRNGQLVYRLSQGNQDELFVINPASGELILQRDLDGRDRVIDLVIIVEDQGSPKKSSAAHLYVVVNGSIGAPSGGGGVAEGRPSGAHFRFGLTREMTIVVVVGCLSVVLAGCLATLLGFLCRRYRRSDERKRGCGDVSKSAANQGAAAAYDDRKRGAEAGCDHDEPVATPLTSVTLVESLDQRSPGDPEDDDGVDGWIHKGGNKQDVVGHLDSGHGSWADSGSDCGTLVLDHGATGPRGYFRRPACFGIREHDPDSADVNFCKTCFAPERPMTSSGVELPANYGHSGAQTLFGDVTAPSSRVHIPQKHHSGSTPRPETFFIRGPPPILSDTQTLNEPIKFHNTNGLVTFSGEKHNFIRNRLDETDRKMQDFSANTAKCSGSRTSSFSSGKSQELKPLTQNRSRAELSQNPETDPEQRLTSTE